MTACKQVCLGELRHRIDLQSRDNVADGQGGMTPGWTTSATVRAKIEPKAAKEVKFAGKVKHRVTHVITIRFRDDVVSHMRILFRDKIFQIHGVRNPMFEDKWLILDCEEGVAS